MDTRSSEISLAECKTSGSAICLAGLLAESDSQAPRPVAASPLPDVAASPSRDIAAGPVPVAQDAHIEASASAPRLSADQASMLETIEQAQFEYFKRESDPVTGLTKDRSTDTSPASIAATGFSLTAYPVAVKHGWVSRDQAADYTLKVLRTLSSAPQGDADRGTSGKNGLFYHFLDPHTGTRTGACEVSTIDTALLMAGVLFSKDYFDQSNSKETEIRNLADQLYKRVDWQWAMEPDGKESMGWTPEKGLMASEWRGMNEGQILMLLGMGSPTHPLPDTAWDSYMSTAQVGTHNGEKSIDFGPLFGHQYMQIWQDFRGIEDATNRKLGFDYFENSRRAVEAQQKYAVDNPQHWRGYGALDWGLSASDGVGDIRKTVDGQERLFFGYGARGFPGAQDDGTIAPTAAAASLPFAPDLVLPTLKHWLKDRPEIFGAMGFNDAFNPTFDTTKPSGWVDSDRLGIDQGPILLMTENYRSGFIWNIMRNDPYFNGALQKAGFTKAANVQP
jgi:hypothetical protein